MSARLQPRSATLYDDIAAAFGVRHVMTPIENALCVTTDEIVADAAEKLASHSFDFAPITMGRQIVGIFEGKPAEGTPGQRVCNVVQRLAPENTVDADAPLEELPAWLCECRFQIVLRMKSVVGLVSSADLNKSAMRSLLFLHIADAERKLAALVRCKYVRDEDWLALLAKSRRDKVLKARDETHRGDVDADLLELVYFTDLISVVKKSVIRDGFEELLGWRLSAKGKGLIDLRNDTCHPIRPILRGIGELQKLVERFKRLHNIIDAADQLLHKWGSETT